MANNLKLNIGDIIFNLSADKGISLISDKLPHYSFRSEDRSEVNLWFRHDLDIHRYDSQFEKTIFDARPSWRLDYYKAKYTLKTRDRIMFLTSEFNEGEVYFDKNRDSFPFVYPLDQILMINLLGRKRGILVHSCGIGIRDQGLLFIGSSGAGKSTIANLWKKERNAVLLNDDRVILRQLDSNFWIYGTPWHGDAKVYSPCKVRLKKIFFLKQAEKNSIRNLDSFSAVSHLVICSFIALWNRDAVSFTLNLCSGLVQDIPCFELNFVPDQSIIRFVKDRL